MSYLPHPDPKKLRDVVARITLALSPVEDQFEAILVTGLSGIVPAAIYCYQSGKRLVVLRKETEKAHGSWLEGDLYKSPYVIVDDFVSSGETLVKLLAVKAAKDPSDPDALPKYIVLYDDFRANTSGLTIPGYVLTSTDTKCLCRVEYKAAS